MTIKENYLALMNKVLLGVFKCSLWYDYEPIPNSTKQIDFEKNI